MYIYTRVLYACDQEFVHSVYSFQLHGKVFLPHPSPRKENVPNLMLWVRFWGHFGPFFMQPYLQLLPGWILIQFGRSMAHVSNIWSGSKFTYISASTNTKLVPDSLHACIKKLCMGQRTRLTRNCCRKCGTLRDRDFEFEIRAAMQATNTSARISLCTDMLTCLPQI